MAPEARRRQILEEATKLISVAGFNAVSLADIADACGIRKPSVLHHFPSMHDLLAAVLAYRDELTTPPDLPDESIVGHPDEIRALLRRIVARNLEMPELVRLYAVLSVEASDPQHPAHDYIVARERRTRADFARMLEWKSDPELAGRELMAFWTGLEREWVLDPSVDFLAVWDHFAARFLTRD
ncbi:TetR family transcriptional regulator [Agromyces mangrovi Wang et al. 2018]|nr:TetR family transcriptional regulator [Agromyces mangrovi]